MEVPIVVRRLFGGAVDLALPTRMVDVSEHRTVPDHQEVFTDANLDQSIIVEFVEHLGVADDECGEAFFCDLADGMDAVDAIENTPPGAGDRPVDDAKIERVELPA